MLEKMPWQPALEPVQGKLRFLVRPERLELPT